MGCAILPSASCYREHSYLLAPTACAPLPSRPSLVGYLNHLPAGGPALHRTRAAHLYRRATTPPMPPSPVDPKQAYTPSWTCCYRSRR